MLKLNFSLSILMLFSLSITNCQSTNTNGKTGTETSVKETATEYVNISGVASNTPEEYLPKKENLSRAYFASGCFWCVEAVYESVKGVEEVVSGYSGGHTENPTYDLSNTGKTGHAEAVEVFYDSTIIDFQTLVEVYFAAQNITQVNGQGPDNGSQYRSIIFYQNDKEKVIIDKKVAALNKELAPEKVGAEVMQFQMFWVAEDYHQNFEKLHPTQGYIRAVSIPRLKRFQEKMPEVLKDEH
jgi:peptide-methionine (S)-S-oxide reductase